MEELLARLAALEARVEALVAENGMLRAENAALRLRVTELETELGKNSNNSSTPPSRDGVAPRKARSLRRAEQKAAGRPKGKQPGTPGRRLEPVDEPDERRSHPPVCCTGCGSGLDAAPVVGTEVRQVFDIPPLQVRVTEHTLEKRRCACGTVTAGVFPADAIAATCWGPEARAYAVYLMDRHHIPVARVAELLSDMVGAPVSTGWVWGCHVEAARRLKPFITELKALLLASPVVHADETGTQVDTVKHWVHTIATGLLTLLVVHKKRGREAIIDMGILTEHTGTVVHDGWAPYDTISCVLAHAQCGAHLLRHLAGLGEVTAAKPFVDAMATVLIAAKTASETAADRGRKRVDRRTAKRIRGEYQAALNVGFGLCPPGRPPRLKRSGAGTWNAWQRTLWNLAHRMDTGADDVLRMLDDTAVPFDNNEAERALRMVKLHDKISGGWRSLASAQDFATVRSYLQTAGKHGINRLDVLRQLFTTGPWLPAHP